MLILEYVFTGGLVSHNAHNHSMDILTAVFRCSRLCYNGYLPALPKIACFKTIGYFCLIAQYKYAVSIIAWKYNAGNL